MGKKKRQGEPNANTDDSCDSSSEEFRNVQECPHVNKAVDLSRLKKTITKCFFQSDCEDCQKNHQPEEPGLENGFIEFDSSLWMCLKCGNQACGRSKNQHALQHFNTPHSDSHSLCVNTSKWCVWCYECDNEINVTCKKKLLECIEYLKKHSETKKARSDNSMATIYDKAIDTIQSNDQLSIITQTTSNMGLPKARGLKNLGNTCFFNSVMQCLGQTPHLLQLLLATSEEGQYFKLPGGRLCLDEKEKQYMELKSLDGTLEGWRQLTSILAQTLSELQSGRPDAYNPGSLLSRLVLRMPQFGGGDQHDSHELLRHLLEAVREDDLRRYQAVILDKLELSVKTNPTSVEGDKKKIIKFYGLQASEMLLPTEQVFRGVLVSTLQCQDCGHNSHRDEFFLDLSLPISEKQSPPILRRKADEIDDNKPSKHQIKKEKKQQAKKNKKSKVSKNNVDISSSIEGEDEKMDDNKSDSESDADVEDNIEDSTHNIHTPEDGPRKGTESGYNSDKNGSPENISPDMCVDDSGIPSPTVGMLSASPIHLCLASPDNSPASSETNIDMGSPICGRNSPIEEMNDEFERPESRLSFVHTKNNDLKADLEKLSLKNETKNLDLDNRLEDTFSGDSNLDEKMEVEDDSYWSGTISDRHHIEEGECSVQSCLNQFTTSELMTANNKVSCEMCTKRFGGPDQKTVYTNAHKQLLIYNPPAVLILHLKRFQVFRFRPAKISKFVKFPTLLDIAPFCSRRSKNLPTFDAGQTKVLYSLYGVVEHSGSMHGGHYVAYVKIRPKLSDESYRWQFLPKNQKKERAAPLKDRTLNEDSLPGKWYYISDSYASEVPESKVLSAQAYLLFYERIM